MKGRKRFTFQRSPTAPQLTPTHVDVLSSFYADRYNFPRYVLSLWGRIIRSPSVLILLPKPRESRLSWSCQKAMSEAEGYIPSRKRLLYQFCTAGTCASSFSLVAPLFLGVLAARVVRVLPPKPPKHHTQTQARKS